MEPKDLEELSDLELAKVVGGLDIDVATQEPAVKAEVIINGSRIRFKTDATIIYRGFKLEF